MFSLFAGFPWPGLVFVGRGGGFAGQSYGERSWVRTALFVLLTPELTENACYEPAEPYLSKPCWIYMVLSTLNLL